MSFGVPEIHAVPLYAAPEFTSSRVSVDQCTVILPDGREVGGYFDTASNNARFYFVVDNHYYSGPVMGNNFSHPPRRGLMEERGSGRLYADLRKWVVERKQ